MSAFYSISSFGPERLIISVLTNFIIALAVFVGLTAVGLTGSMVIAITIILFLTGTVLIAGWVPAEINGIGKRKPWLSAAWLLTALVSVILITRLSLFMLYPAQSKYSLFPGDPWLVEHCCLTAYSESASLTKKGEPNVYIQKHYIDRKLSGFKVDNYHYPPPFLLLPLTMQVLTGNNFLNLRMLWFSVSVITLMIAIILIIYRLEPKGKMRLIGMVPFLLCSLPIVVGLQMSNVQIMLISVSIIAMVLFQKQPAAGGMLLAMSAAAKIFPGVLGFYLLVGKKWSQVVWTAVFVISLTIITYLVLGADPFRAFFQYEMPMLSSGEAFARPFSRVFAASRNMSPFGIAVKLEWLGADGIGLTVGPIIGSVYIICILVLAFWSARKQSRSGTETISIWIALLSLGSLASPFAPANYVLIPVMILVCVNREIFRPLITILIWLIICVPFYVDRDAPFVVQALSFLPAQIIALAIPAFILYRAGAYVPEEKQTPLPGTGLIVSAKE